VYANVIIAINTEKLDRTFQYSIPEELLEVIRPGVMVNVSFGPRTKEAIVVEVTDIPEIEIERIKPISGLVVKQVSIEQKMVELAAFIKRNYGGTMLQALKVVLPVKRQIKANFERTVNLEVDNTQLLEEISKTPARNRAMLRLLNLLCDNKSISYDKLIKEYKISLPTIKAYVAKGIISIDSERVYRSPINFRDIKDTLPSLTQEQQEIVEEISGDLENELHKTYLIHGITGSGKTEVYLRIASKVLESGRQVIMLIPEISLTTQTVDRFYRRFGDNVAIINSMLSEGEKYDQMMLAKEGLVNIVIGPRSALFAPFDKLGLIIIDEEHEGAYKSESVPRYNAIGVAKELARMNNASLILGSATPLVESYYHSMIGEYKLFKMRKRANEDAVLPKIHVVDMREELRMGNRSIFSLQLDELIKDRLNKQEQIMLFINRRGVANFISCRSCGEVFKCPHCDVSLKLHKNNTLMCHYCGYKIPKPDVCPKCGSKYIAGFNVGTEKVEELIHKQYKTARVLRMDADTTSKKADYERIINAFRNHEADILVGTQMIVKGHDFPNVTLMGVLAADISLYSNNYMARERTYELIVQACGRSGRSKQGAAVIQTYTPEDNVIVSGAKANYDEFYQEEIRFRQNCNYPPFSNMLVVRVSSKYDDKAYLAASNILERIKENSSEDMNIVGPSEANLFKLKDVYTYIVSIRYERYNGLVFIKDNLEKYIKDNRDFRYISVQFDFNPYNM